MRFILTLVLTWATLAAPITLANDLEAGTSQQSSSNEARPPSRWWTIEKYRQELKLTAEQSAEIERIVQTSMGRLKADKEDLDRAQSDFRQLMERPSVPERDLLKAAERLEMARYSISKERTTMLVRIHNVLAPEQRRGLDAIARRHEASRQQAQQQQR
jgi:Spy/CpxP family protein refolding chaperone